ncbi:MAG TPA: GNAT family N-acetyltransferase [Chloroflexia bacterium]|jgi:ribosomal protein S18 acetylase RimI-like enzyme
MKLVALHDKVEIEGFVRRNPFLHIYSLGDLDDFFWPGTVWYALKDGKEIKQILLMYVPLKLPSLQALTEEPEEMSDLLGAASHLLPRRFYAHLSEGLANALEDEYQVNRHGIFHKMALTEPSQLQTIDTSEVVSLTTADLPDLERLYSISYPGNWFDRRMLETGQYYGMRRGAGLVGVAGVHVYSEKYRVAALGNVATHPDYRGRGIATTICAKLCKSLLQKADHVGLNVKAENTYAIRAYERLGFKRIATYEECTLSLPDTNHNINARP